MSIGREGNHLVTEASVIQITSDTNMYLDVQITEDGGDKKHIVNKEIIRQLSFLLWSNTITKITKIRLSNSIVQSYETCGSKIWTLNTK